MSRPLVAALLLAAGLAIPARAQTRPVLEALGGVSSAKLASNGEVTDALYGMSFGVAADLRVRERLSLRGELHVVEKGGSERIGGTALAIDLRAVDLPILASYRLAPEARVSPTLVFGPSASYLLSCTGAQQGSGALFAGDCTRAVNRVDMTLLVGGGVDFDGSGFPFGLHVRYQHGLADLSKSDGFVRTRTLQVLLAVRR